MGREIIRVKEVKELSAYFNGWLTREDVRVAKNDGRHSGEQEDFKPDTENCIGREKWILLGESITEDKDDGIHSLYGSG